MRIAVTGGNGDLGRNLVPHLLAEGHSVVSIDRALPPRLAPLPQGNVVYLIADTCDFGQYVASIRDCDALIHLAAHRSPLNAPDPVVYIENTAGTYNALSAAAALGIKRVCLASSVNALGGAFSRAPRYDYFPLDEGHSTYTEDSYSLSKWVGEQQADAFARRYEWLSIASLRFHWLLNDYAQAVAMNAANGATAIRHLWAWTSLAEASRACLLALTAPFVGHEVCYIVAPTTTLPTPSRDLAHEHYPATLIRGELAGHTSFFDSRKAERVLGWHHAE